MTSPHPQSSGPMPPERSDEIKKGLDILSRATERAKQLPNDFTPSTSFSANLKSSNPSIDPYHVSFSEIREFMANNASQEELSPN